MMSFAAIQMDLGIIMSGEISQREEDKYHMLSLICGIFKKMIQMSSFTKQKQIHRPTKQTYGYEKEIEERR